MDQCRDLPEHVYTCEVSVSYRKTIAVSAPDKEMAEELAIRHIESRAAEIIDSAEILVQVEPGGRPYGRDIQARVGF